MMTVIGRHLLVVLHQPDSANEWWWEVYALTGDLLRKGCSWDRQCAIEDALQFLGRVNDVDPALPTPGRDVPGPVGVAEG